MSEIYNIYCDESCHLENDKQSIMVLGAVWCPLEKTRKIAERIREIKEHHKIYPFLEIKWTKVSPAQENFYLDLLDYFFDNNDIHFRALIVNNKDSLSHKEFLQDHDTWYYKMYFELLKILLNPDAQYRIYLDIKDTKSASKITNLHNVLCNNVYDFNRKIITRVQTVRSHEVEQIQLADFLLGIVSYANRNLQTSPAKLKLVERMRKRSGYSLSRSTLYRANKVNLFHWYPSEKQNDNIL